LRSSRDRGRKKRNRKEEKKKGDRGSRKKGFTFAHRGNDDKILQPVNPPLEGREEKTVPAPGGKKKKFLRPLGGKGHD